LVDSCQSSRSGVRSDDDRRCARHLGRLSDIAGDYRNCPLIVLSWNRDIMKDMREPLLEGLPLFRRSYSQRTRGQQRVSPTRLQEVGTDSCSLGNCSRRYPDDVRLRCSGRKRDVDSGNGGRCLDFSDNNGGPLRRDPRERLRDGRRDSHGLTSTCQPMVPILETASLRTYTEATHFP